MAVYDATFTVRHSMRIEASTEKEVEEIVRDLDSDAGGIIEDYRELIGEIEIFKDEEVS